MKKLIKIAALVLAIAALAAPLASCKTQSSSAAPEETTVGTVTRGSLSVDITSAGNLALAQMEDLAFEVAGTVEEVTVDAGDLVTKGQVLAKLDADEWNDHIDTLNSQLTTAESALRTKQRALTTAERQLDTKKRAVLSKQRSVLSSENSVKNAEKTLVATQSTYTWPDIEAAQAEYDRAKVFLENAIEGRSEASGGLGTAWDRTVANAQAQFTAAETQLKAILANLSPEEVVAKQNEIEIAKGNLEETKLQVIDAQKDVEDAQLNIEDTKLDITEAEKDVANAQEALDEAKATSLEVTAPFDGFVTAVNVEGGDEVTKGTIAVQVADPAKFEVEILVSEMDIFKVQQDGAAYVTADALSGIRLPATVTHISPTATIQSGVVNYKVKVELSTLPSLTQATTQPTQTTATPSTTQGSTPSTQSRLQGLSTEQRQQLQSRISSGAARGQTGGVPLTNLQSVELKAGLSVTVGITVVQKTDVVLVPSRAITREGTTSYVQVQKADSTLEKRSIKTGMSDWQNTEVTEGLSEGEKVVLPKVVVPTSSSSSSNQFRAPAGMGAPVVIRN